MQIVVSFGFPSAAADPLTVLIRLFQRYPEHVHKALWAASIVSSMSMLVSSWATEVSRPLRCLIAESDHNFRRCGSSSSSKVSSLRKLTYDIAQVWQLIILQGLLCGVSGAVLYAPVLMWLQDWWVARRGMASGVM